MVVQKILPQYKEFQQISEKIVALNNFHVVKLFTLCNQNRKLPALENCKEKKIDNHSYVSLQHAAIMF